MTSNKEINIINYDEYCNEPEKPFIIPQIKCAFRMIISSKSAGGKTNLLLNLVLQPLVYYDKLIVFSPTLEQPKYKMMMEFFEDLYQDDLNKCNKKSGANRSTAITTKQLIHNKYTVSDIEKLSENFIQNKEDNKPVERIAEFYDDMSKLPSCNSLEKDKHILIVVDDCMLEKNQTKILEYFVKGRHKHISIIYQTQKFSYLPTAMREQSTHYIFLGIVNNMLLNTIAMSVPIGLDYKSLKKLYKTYVKEPFDFIMFNTTSPKHDEIIYKNLSTPIDINSVIVD